jgi:hypothetical protein
MTEPANEAVEVEDPALPAGTAATNTPDDDEDFEDLEFLLDDIEDQIAPLGLS